MGKTAFDEKRTFESFWTLTGAKKQARGRLVAQKKPAHQLLENTIESQVTQAIF